MEKIALCQSITNIHDIFNVIRSQTVKPKCLEETNDIAAMIFSKDIPWINP